MTDQRASPELDADELWTGGDAHATVRGEPAQAGLSRTFSDVRFRAFVSAAFDACYDWDLQSDRLEMSGQIDEPLGLEAGPLPTVRLPEGGDGEQGEHGEHECDGDAAEVHDRMVRRRDAGPQG